MVQMNFGYKWRNWISCCLSSTKASILVNGAPIEEFSITKGVRQGGHCHCFSLFSPWKDLILLLEVPVKNPFFMGSNYLEIVHQFHTFFMLMMRYS